MQSHEKAIKRTAFLTGLILGILLLISLVAIFYPRINSHEEQNKVQATIYQHGNVIHTICLSDVTEPYTLSIKGENGCENIIEVRPGSIGIISSTCPDKICVHQGFIGPSSLPIVCLPNDVVIQVTSSDDSDTIINTY